MGSIASRAALVSPSFAKMPLEDGFMFLETLKNTISRAVSSWLRSSKASENSAVTVKKIFAPVNGNLFPLKQSADPAHQQEALGKGVCIMPLGGKIYAPIDGIIEMLFDTKHAIDVKSTEGIEVLIHCGIDTVKLGGKGFTAHVQEGDTVKAGQLLLEYDEDIITRAGYSLETQVVVTNTAGLKVVTQEKTGDCTVGDLILSIE